MCTPLHFAVEAGLPQVVKHLLDKGADLYAKDGKNNLRVFDIAMNSKYPEIVKVVQKHKLATQNQKFVKGMFEGKPTEKFAPKNKESSAEHENISTEPQSSKKHKPGSP